VVARSSRALLAGALAVAAGCSAVLGMDAPKLDPCATGCADAPPVDAPPSTDAEADSPVDAGGVDRATPVDAPDADAGFACPTGAFCDDFEHADKQGPWDSLSEDVAGTFAIDTAFYRSPTRSSRFDLAQTIDTVTAQLSKVVSRNVGSATFAFSFRMDALPTTTVQIESLGWSDGTANAMQVALVFAPGGVALSEDGAPADANYIEHPLSRQPQAGAWVRVEVEVHVGVQPATASVRLDGEVAFTGALQAGFAPGPVTVRHGVASADQPDAWRFWVDDVVLATQ
jgi:hypothetical protein